MFRGSRTNWRLSQGIFITPTTFCSASRFHFTSRIFWGFDARAMKFGLMHWCRRQSRSKHLPGNPKTTSALISLIEDRDRSLHHLLCNLKHRPVTRPLGSHAGLLCQRDN